MPTQHTYFNLDAFANPDTDLIWNHTLSMPSGKRYLEPDSGMVPTGKVISLPKDDVNDFWSQPRQLGFASTRPEFKGNCGGGCSGYNNEWIFNEGSQRDVVVSLSSDWSGTHLIFPSQLT
jgi:aldose 1-epimerase